MDDIAKKRRYKKQKQWRLTHTAYRNQERARYYKKHSINKLKSRSLWGPTDLDRVLEHSIPDVLLSQQIHRSVKAIQVCRAKLKREIRNEQGRTYELGTTQAGNMALSIWRNVS